MNVTDVNSIRHISTNTYEDKRKYTLDTYCMCLAEELHMKYVYDYTFLYNKHILVTFTYTFGRRY
jgi:hypothetical protein